MMFSLDLATRGPESLKPRIFRVSGSIMAEAIVAIGPAACMLKIGVPIRRFPLTNIS